VAAGESEPNSPASTATQLPSVAKIESCVFGTEWGRTTQAALCSVLLTPSSLSGRNKLGMLRPKRGLACCRPVTHEWGVLTRQHACVTTPLSQLLQGNGLLSAPSRRGLGPRRGATLVDTMRKSFFNTNSLPSSSG
jgi:hypothetical protein